MQDTGARHAGRALPRPTQDDAPFFASVHARNMALQRCVACRRFRYYPAPICPHCASFHFAWEPVSGRGTVHSFTWVYRAAPGFEAMVPYAYGVVELEEGPMMTTVFVDVGIDQLRIGLPALVSYEQVTEDCTLPYFKVLPAGAA